MSLIEKPSAVLIGTGSEWLLILAYAGQEYLLGEQEREVLIDNNLFHIHGCLPQIEFTEGIRLPGDTSTTNSLSLSLVLPLDVSAFAMSIPLSTARASLCRWVPMQDWTQRRVVLEGRIRDPEYGEEGEPISFTLEELPWQNSVRLPARTQKVDGSTWPNSITTLQEQNAGAVYPLVFGRPGARSDGSQASATPARWVWHAPEIPTTYSEYIGLVLVIAGHAVSAARVYLHCDAYSPGFRVPVFVGTDGRGQTVSFVPWYASKSGTNEDYDFDIGGTYSASISDFDGSTTYGLGFRGTLPDGQSVSALTSNSTQPQFWVTWYDEESASQGGMMQGDTLIREAVDVLGWLLARTGMPVDHGSLAVASHYLKGWKLDFSIYSDCDLWEFVQAHLLPILPLAVTSGSQGWTVAVWRWEASRYEAVIHLEEGPEVERISSVSEDASNIRNRFRLQFSKSNRVGKYMEEVELSGDPYDGDDPDHEPSQVCRISRDIYGDTEEEVLQSDIVYDRSTARNILRHKALTYALPRKRVRYQVVERLASGLRSGAVITLTDARLHWNKMVWLVEDLILKSGVMEIGLIRAA